MALPSQQQSGTGDGEGLTPELLVAQVSKLVSFPEVALAVDKALADGKSTAADIGGLIAPDPALSASLLRLANSAMYSKRGNIDSVERAVALVGAREIRDLTFAVAAAQTFSGISSTLLTVEDFWFHSLACGAAARILAKRLGLKSADSVFTAGLLHDVGQLVMYSQASGPSADTLRHSRTNNDGLMPYLSERAVFGFDHMAVGAALAREWGFPDALVRAIEFHHEPERAEEAHLAEIGLITAANSIAVLVEVDSHSTDDMPPIATETLEALGLSLDDLGDIVEETKPAVDDLLRVFVS
ncbi:MAG: HDOD domain-containing protein [Pseudomonadota bacterium]